MADAAILQTILSMIIPAIMFVVKAIVFAQIALIADKRCFL